MSIAYQVYEELKSLPDQMALEVLDFVAFLRERRERAEWRDLMNAQESKLSALWDNSEDDVWNNV